LIAEARGTATMELERTTRGESSKKSEKGRNPCYKEKKFK